jgi:LuxR family maltose regulon positive regulatory protein
MKSTATDPSERYRPPAITGHEIVRIRLLDRLTSVPEASTGARVTLVRGPAGFGKTTLLAQAYRQVVARSGAAVWLGCHSVDASSSHFLESLYLAATLIGIEPDDFEFTATDLARRLAQVDPGVFIFLDEYERLAGSPAEDVMEHLVSALPTQAHIVVGSRHSPRSWFLRRELRGDAATIDALELRLTGDELRTVLQERFNTAEIAQLEALTEGWPMAVQLARLRCRDAQSLTDLLAAIERGDSGLFEYLTERVVESLSEDQQRLLRDTSILEFVTPQAANSVLGRDDGYALLTSVIHLQPIVTVTSDAELTIRLHPLFRQFMRDQLARQGRHRESQLQRRAAEFFASRWRMLEAVQYALAADDPAQAVALLDRAGGEELIFHSGPRKMHSIAECLPPEARPFSIRLRFTDFLITTLNGQTVRAAALRSRLEVDLAAMAAPHNENPPRWAATPIDPHWPEFAHRMAALAADFLADMFDGCQRGGLSQAYEADRFCRRHFAHSECYLGFVLAFEVLLLARHGDVATARSFLVEYQALCERNGFAPKLPSINPQRGLLAFLAGEFDQAVALLTRSADLRLDRFAEPELLLAQLSKALLAVILYERNNIDEAAEVIAGLRVDMDATVPEVPPLALRIRSLCARARGQYAEADRILGDALLQAERRGARRLCQYIAALRLELSARPGTTTPVSTTPDASNDIDGQAKLEKWLNLELERSEPSWMMVEQGIRALATTLCSVGRGLDAKPIIQRALMLARAQGRVLLEAVCQILLAGCDAESNPDGSVDSLRLALELTSRMDVVRPYLDLVPTARRLVIAAAAGRSDSRIAQHAGRVLQLLGDPAGNESDVWQALSQRERDILLALAGNATTKSAARALGLSPETVKHHLKSIYAKLGVHTREEALGLLAQITR